MFSFSTNVRVHYAMTDQMGFVYYGNYAQFFEIGRVEAIRSLGMTYKDFEKQGFLLAVGQMNIRYLKPVLYDELITVEVAVRELKKGVKLMFYGEIMDESGSLTTTSEIILYCIDSTTKRPTALPDSLFNLLQPFFL